MNNQKGEVATATIVVVMVVMMAIGHLGMLFGGRGHHHHMGHMGHMEHKDDAGHNHDGKDERADAGGHDAHSGEVEKAPAPAEEGK